MPVSGQEILRRITDFAAVAANAEKDARQATERMSGEIDRLVTSQSDAIRELAQLYLPRLDHDVERGGWSEMRALLQSVLLRKEDARRRLRETLDQVTQRRETLELTCQEMRTRFRDLTEKYEQVSEELSSRLTADSEFQSLSRHAAEGQARLEQAEASLIQVKADAASKLPAYHSSTLFQYLHRRQFGTPAYHRRGMTYRLDRWVSRLIDYPRASAGYQFLTSAPVRMNRLISEQKTALKSLMEEVERRHLSAAGQLGLPDLQAEHTAVQSELETAEVALDHARKQEAEASHELAELDSPDCEYYRDAVRAFQDLIHRTERSVVASRAAETPDNADDQIVARLRHLDNQIVEKRRHLELLHRSAEEAAQRTSRILELASKGRRAQFDHPRRIFDDQFDLQPHLQNLLAGRTSADDVYREMYRNQRLDSPIADQAAAALDGPMAHLMLQTMAHAAGVALGAYARRAGQSHRLPRKNRDDHLK